MKKSFLRSVNNIEGDADGNVVVSGGASIVTAFTNVPYAATLSRAYNPLVPNIEIDITDSLDLTITGTVNGDSGLVNLYFAAAQTATLQGFTDLVITGAGAMIPVYFVHDGDGVKWYQEKVLQDLQSVLSKGNQIIGQNNAGSKIAFRNTTAYIKDGTLVEDVDKITYGTDIRLSFNTSENATYHELAIRGKDIAFDYTDINAKRFTTSISGGNIQLEFGKAGIHLANQSELINNDDYESGAVRFISSRNGVPHAMTILTQNPYSTITSPTDILILKLPKYTGPESKTLATLDDVANSRPYKVYIALLTQTGTNAPTTIILENTIGTLVWTYFDTGIYKATLINSFTLNKTAVFITSQGFGGGFGIVTSASAANNANEVLVITQSSGGPVNGNLNQTTIEIRVYN